MKQIAVQTIKNAQRHFIVWGLIGVVISFGIMDNNKSSVERPVASGSLAHVLDNNVCENTIEGEFPTGAIVREVGAGYSLTTNPVMIGKGLDEEFGNKEWERFDVVHFCK